MDEQKGTYNYYDDWDNVSAIVQFPDMQFFIPYYRSKDANLYLQKACGNGMIKAGIKNGDNLLMDRNLTPADGDIVTATINGKLMCRRYFVRNGKVHFRREDGITPDIVTDDYEIHAVIIAIFRAGRFSSKGYDPDNPNWKIRMPGAPIKQ